MTDLHPTDKASSLFGRIKGLLLRPDLEWPVIAAESATVKTLFQSYAMPLALIGPVAAMFYDVVIKHESVIEAVAFFAFSYGFSLLATYVLGIVVDGLAETFGSPKNRLASMKLAVYAMTPFWLIGALGLISPSLSLALTLTLGLYGPYLLYRGLEPLKHTPANKRLVYTLAASVIWLVLTLVVTGLILAVVSAFSIVGQGSLAILDL